MLETTAWEFTATKRCCSDLHRVFHLCVKVSKMSTTVNLFWHTKCQKAGKIKSVFWYEAFAPQERNTAVFILQDISTHQKAKQEHRRSSWRSIQNTLNIKGVQLQKKKCQWLHKSDISMESHFPLSCSTQLHRQGSVSLKHRPRGNCRVVGSAQALCAFLVLIDWIDSCAEQQSTWLLSLIRSPSENSILHSGEGEVQAIVKAWLL